MYKMWHKQEGVKVEHINSKNTTCDIMQPPPFSLRLSCILKADLNGIIVNLPCGVLCCNPSSVITDQRTESPEDC